MSRAFQNNTRLFCSDAVDHVMLERFKTPLDSVYNGFYFSDQNKLRIRSVVNVLCLNVNGLLLLWFLA